MSGQSDYEKNQQQNRERDQQRFNQGQDPGPAHPDLAQKYKDAQDQKRRNDDFHSRNSNTSSGNRASSSSPNQVRGGQSDNGCFPAGTLVRIPGGQTAIECLSIGDTVMSYDFKTGSLKSSKVLATKSHDNNTVISLEFANGALLHTTPVHNLLINGSWKMAKRARPGDQIQCVDDQGNITEHKLVAASTLPEAKRVYNLVTEQQHNFVAEGFIAHNFAFCKSLRILLSRLLHAEYRGLFAPRSGGIRPLT